MTRSVPGCRRESTVFYSKLADRWRGAQLEQARHQAAPLRCRPSGIYSATQDKAFIAEMHQRSGPIDWWYRARDNNRNSIIDNGATRHVEHNDEFGNITFKVRYPDRGTGRAGSVEL